MKKADYDYFKFFSDMTKCASEAAGALGELLSDYDHDTLSQRRGVIHDIEHRADSLKHDMTENLLHEFLPPFDREDIILFSGRLDDIVDCIDDIALSFYMYDVHECRGDVKEFSAIIASCCDKLVETVEMFPRYKRDRDAILNGIIGVHELEGEGDECHVNAMHSLFSDGTDAAAVCAWKDIYDRFESCCDACERAVDAVEQIILKNS